MYRHIKRKPISFRDVARGRLFRYYGVMQSLHGTPCKITNVRPNGKIDAVLLEGPKEGVYRRGLKASMLGEYAPEVVAWEL